MHISKGERLLAVLGYLAFLFIIPVKVRRDSMFVQFHARQGGVLFGLWFVYSLLVTIVLFVVDEVNVAATIVMAFLFIGFFVYAALALIGIFKVALGERYRMPGVADVALLLRL